MTNHETAAARLRTYLRLLPTAHNLGGEIAYSEEFRSEEWPRSCYAPTREDVEALLAAVSVPPPAPRADAWLDAAAYLETLDPAEAALSGQYAWHNAAAHLRRKAGEELFAATPCSPIVGCEPGGEPCDTHERLLGHIEGDHELCGPECGGLCVAGEQQNETPETEPGCAHCGKTIRRITGTLAEWWVHEPGGHTVCFPEQAASSPRATPKPAAGAPTATKPETAEPAVTLHAIPLPGSNGISSCCGRPPCEFVGERVTRDPAKVTCTGPAAGVRQDGAQQ